jgi:hypothetical protein
MNPRSCAVALTLTLVVLYASVAPAETRTPPVCRELANVFYIIAGYEARGDSKASQLVWLREEYAPDEETSPLGIFDRALDYVYESDAEPKEIRASVMDHCVVDERGQAVLRLPGL